MTDNNQLLKQIRTVVREEIKAETEPINKRLDVQGSSLSHITTAVEAVKAGQDDVREKVANLPTRPEFQDFRADIGRKIQDHANRIEKLEKDAGIPHPHKH